jgi:inorganic pyrophosphatase/exopolyphosphatase
MRKPIYVLGHRNPDTDSICSAIAYAFLKKALGQNAVPARAGKINPETRYILNYFKVPDPILVHDLYPSLDDVTLLEPPVVKPQDTLRMVGKILVENDKLKAIPVLDDKKHIAGIVTTSDLARYWYQEVLLREQKQENITYSSILSINVGEIMTKQVVGFKLSDMLSDVRAKMLSTKYVTYPVTEQDCYIGMIDRGMMLEPNRQKVILVDHNERSQAVEGIDEAQILEIIDHHRLGGLTTGMPIFIRQEPVGSTATIVATLTWHRGVTMTPAIAGILFSAIISDTLYFKSPTATALDKEVATKLAALAGIKNQEELAMDILRHGSSLTAQPVGDIVRTDIKEFDFEGTKVTVGQINSMDRKETLAQIPKLTAALEKFRVQEGYDLSLLMLTDIISSGTDLIAAGEPKAVLRSAFGEPDEAGHFYLPGVLSRKKQIIPPLTEAFKNR